MSVTSWILPTTNRALMRQISTGNSTNDVFILAHIGLIMVLIGFCHVSCSRKTMNNLGIKLEEYWKEIRHKRKEEDPNCLPVEDTTLVHFATTYISFKPHSLHALTWVSINALRKRPDQNWVQCDECLKWRKLPDGIDCSKLPDKWFCYLNPAHQYR